MKNIETFALVIPDDIALLGNVGQKMTSVKLICEDKLLGKTWDTSVVFIKVRDASMILGFLSDDLWFLAGMPGNARTGVTKIIKLNEYQPENMWLNCYQAVDKKPMVSDILAEVVNFIYENRKVLFNTQNRAKIEEKKNNKQSVSED